MKVIPIPCLNDNFAYLLICPETNEAAVVDPSEYEPVFKEVQNRKVTLTTIFNTHHHWDHVGGNDELSRHFPGIKIHAHMGPKTASVSIMIPTNADGVRLAPIVIKIKPKPN